ncbi:MAG: ChaN family lipoprotein [Desulfomicrobiaceae bacterium]
MGLAWGLLVGLLLSLGACAPHAPKPLQETPERGLLSAQGTPLSASALTAMAAQADYILIGETHANPCDHAAAAEILHALAGAGIRFDLGLEMLPRESQPFLDQHPSREDLARHWDAAWGYPFTLYAPVLEAARAHGARLVGLNVPWALVQDFRDGRLAPDHPALPRALIPPCPEQERGLAEQFALHQKMRPESATKLSDFLRVQSLWDSVMAETAIQWRRQHHRPVVILTGAGHVERGFGIPYRIAALEPEAKMLAILPWRDASSQEEAVSSCTPHLRTAFFVCPPTQHSRLGMLLDFRDTITVQRVEPGSRAEAMGLQAGDRIVAVGGTPVHTAEDLHSAAATAARRGEAMRFTVERHGQTITLTMPPR